MSDDGLRDEIVGLASEAIRLPSTSDRPEILLDCLRLFTGHLAGGPVAVEERDFDGVPSAVVRPKGVDRPRVILCGHLDVVPGDEAQFEPRLEGDRLYGRGALDMKGSLAAVTAAFRRTAGLRIPWWLLIVSDEEVGGTRGAARWAAERWDAELFVACEPTNLALSLQSKGALRLEFIHHGRAAHGSAPWEGESSVERMMQAQPAIRRVIPEVSAEAWVTTASLTMIDGGAVINQVPDRCSLSVDVRYVPGDDPQALLARLREALPGFEVNVLNLYPPMVCREDSPLLAPLRAACREVTGTEPALGREHGATDARYFSDRMDALIFGPVGQDLHGPAEWVGVDSLVKVALILERWGTSLAG